MFLFFFLFFHFASSRSVTIDLIRKPLTHKMKLQNPFMSNYQSNVCLGEPKQCLDFVIDPICPYIWVTDTLSDSIMDKSKKYSLAKSNTKYFDPEERDVSYSKFTFLGYVITEKIEFSNSPISLEIMMLDVKKVTNADDISGVIGLNHTDAIASLPDHLIQREKLFTNNIITISLSHDNNNNFGKIIFGEIPLYAIGNPANGFGYCKGTGYKCSLKYISVPKKEGEELYDIEEDVVFDLNTNKIIAPFYFMFYIESVFLKNLFYQNLCQEKELYQYFTFVCSTIDGIDKNGFTFVFDTYGMKLTINNLFIKTDEGYEFVLYSDKSITYWIFGLPIFDLFEITFDRDKHIIGFYSTMNTVQVFNGPVQPIYMEGSKKAKENKHGLTWKIISFWIMVLVFIIFLFVLFLVIRKIRRDKLKEKPIEVDYQLNEKIM